MQQKSKDCLDMFRKFIKSVQDNHPVEMLEKAEQIYAVRQFKITQLTPTMADEIYQNIYLKFNRNLIPKFQLNWWENQLRIFVWVLVLYVELKRTSVQDLNSDDWNFFSCIFPHKKLIIFEYQSINILKQHGQAKKWIPEEDDLFSILVHEKGLKCKWSQLAKLLYIQSDKKFFRTPKQCRQRWLNHLDPSKSKSQWTARQDYILIRYVSQKEKRWAQISKLLQNKRNQHSIKNRFKSLITKQQKYHKQKLQEEQLIGYIYKRYTTHLTSLNCKFEETYQALSQSQKKQISKVGHQIQNRQNSFLPTVSNSKSQENIMFPFIYHPKSKDDQSFTPFRRSQQFLPLNSSQKQFRNISQNIPTSMDELINPYMQYNHPEGFFLTKFKTELKLPNKNFDFEDNSNQEQNRQFYSNVLEENLINQNNDLPMGRSFDQFLPIFGDQYQDSQSLEHQIFQEPKIQNLPKINSMQSQKQKQMEEDQRRIRAEIFVSQDPFQYIRSFFYKKKLNGELLEKK